MKAWHDECAVFGVWNHADAARLSYLGLYAMQHRGQESAGIVSLHDGRHFVHKGLGLVADVFTEKQLSDLPGSTAIGHTRYSTTGGNLLTNAQPMVANLSNGPVAIAHNGNLVNAAVLRKQLQAKGAIFQGTNDTECVLHMMAHAKTDNFIEAIKQVIAQLEGAFSFTFLSHNALVAVRDRHGFRPLVLGHKIDPQTGKAGYIIASETCALDLIEAQYVREIRPGEMFWVDAEGEHSIQWTDEIQLAKCVFEQVYFARADSIVFGQSVYESRKSFGRWLAKESHVAADIVIPVPDSGIPSAMGYAAESGVPFEFGIIRNHYIGRTFIQPHQSVRNLGVKIKLNPQTAVLAGKRVVVVDDSLVRGTTSQKIVGMIRQAGAKEVHMRIASPPTIGPCYYGVDTPQKSQLIAAHQSLEEIRRFIEADSLSYLSMEGLFHAVNEKPQQRSYCAACFDGKYPTKIERP